MKLNTEYKILIADEDVKTVEDIKHIFDREKLVHILHARTADVAIAMVKQRKPDIIVSNTSLLDLTGWDVLGIVRKNYNTRSIPFIMIDEKSNSHENELKSFSLGADDYIIKPLRPEVFFARIKAVLKRCSGKASQANEPEEILKSGNIVVNISTHIVTIDGKKIKLAPKEFALLRLFIQKKSMVLNKTFLSSVIWDREHFNTSYTIDKHIANLRKKLGKEGRRIGTLPTIGYKFLEEDEENTVN